MLKDTYLIEKRNILNELRTKNMTLQELRLFNIYLAKINARDKSTSKVRFPLDDFKKIMDFGRMNVSQLKETTDKLLTKVVHIPNEKGGFTAFVLFQDCTVNKDQNGTWYIEINASEKALPLMFDFRENYFKYELWNALSLSSANQLRMYEILKQHEYQKTFEVSVNELKSLLGIEEYANRFDNFRRRVLDNCQKAIEENTDIKFTYERGQSGQGGKWLTIKFNISRNENNTRQLTFLEFLAPEEVEEIRPERLADENDIKTSYLNYFNDFEYKFLESTCINSLMMNGIEDTKLMKVILSQSLKLFEIELSKKEIKNNRAYMQKVIEDQSVKEIEKYKNQNKQKKEQSYDIDEFEKFAVTFSGNTKK